MRQLDASKVLLISGLIGIFNPSVNFTAVSGAMQRGGPPGGRVPPATRGPPPKPQEKKDKTAPPQEKKDETTPSGSPTSLNQNKSGIPSEIPKGDLKVSIPEEFIVAKEDLEKYMKEADKVLEAQREQLDPWQAP